MPVCLQKQKITAYWVRSFEGLEIDDLHPFVNQHGGLDV